MAELVKNNKGIQILTDTGWSEFDGVMIKSVRDVFDIALEDGTSIKATADHKIYTETMLPVAVQNLTNDHAVITYDSISKVQSVTPSSPELVYDIYNVKNNNRFIANGMLISNCEFVIFEETLISSLFLTTMEGVDPMRNMGQVRWYKYPDPRNTYVVSLDPSSGTGGDPAAIQVIELPTMEQVAEWQHNKTPVEGQIKTMMDIMQYLREMGVSQTYWSVENNTIGEAALVVIRDTGEENFPGDFLSEPKKASGGRIARKGFNTSHKTKLEAALVLKRLVENDKLKISSKPLIKELKNFVARGNSFSAKPGEHDDLVMSLILSIRMIEYISTFEDDVYDAINSNVTNILDLDGTDDWDAPLPYDFL